MVEGPKATEELTWTMQEVSAVQPHKRDQPPIAFHDLEIVPGASWPTHTGIGSGDLPAPWNPPLFHTHQRVHGNRALPVGYNRGAIT